MKIIIGILGISPFNWNFRERIKLILSLWWCLNWINAESCLRVIEKLTM